MKKLTWIDHIHNISLKISRITGVLNRAKHFISQESLRIPYLTLVQLHFIYCCIVWASTHLSKLTSLVYLQKRLVRILTNSSYREHTQPLFYDLGLLKLNDVFTYQVSLFMFNNTESKSILTILAQQIKFRYPKLELPLLNAQFCS